MGDAPFHAVVAVRRAEADRLHDQGSCRHRGRAALGVLNNDL
jgi:hypothetical protein